MNSSSNSPSEADAPRYGSLEAPTTESVRARRMVLDAVAAKSIDSVREALRHPHDSVRATALVGLNKLDALDQDTVSAAATDTSPAVRRQLAQLGATHRPIPLGSLLADDDQRVAEMAAWAFGERETVDSEHVQALCAMATDHPDALCREAAVAALGAIGDPAGLAAILTATADRATVRRRAILALAPFESPAVDEALQEALTDRDWQVRQAAEDLL